MNNKAPAWNKYVSWIGVILVIVSLLSMIFAIPPDSSLSTGLLAARHFIAIVGPIVVIVFLLSGGRERKLKNLAAEFGLIYEGRPHVVLEIGDPQEAVLNRLSGQINGHSVLIEDRQKLTRVPLGGPGGGSVAFRKTVILEDQIEQKISTSLRFTSIREIKRWLVGIK